MNSRPNLKPALPQASLPWIELPVGLGVALYLCAAAGVLALASASESEVLVALMVVSLAAGVALASWYWVALPLLFFSALEFTPWDYSFDEVAAIVAAGAILCGLMIRRALPRSEGRQASEALVRRQQNPASIRFLRGFVNRQTVDAGIDLFRLRLDAFPYGRYQPIEVLPGRVKRADGSISRWQAMLPVVEELEVESAVDIGANEGYFSLQLGALGVPTVAVEPDPTNYRTALLALKRSGLDNVAVMAAVEVREDTVALTPAADCTVFLSLWHHLVRWQGLEAATAITSRLWEKTGRVMFFDTGEEEMPDSFRLPAMGPDSRAWLERYLSETCEGSRVQFRGRHAAFDADGGFCERNLFAVLRDPR